VRSHTRLMIVVSTHMKANVPFKLSEGLLSEKCGVLLPWSSSVQSLMGLGNPKVTTGKRGAISLSWENEAVLGGLAVRIDMAAAAGPSIFYLTPEHRAGGVEAEYSQIKTWLEERLGPPHEETTDDGYPWTKWQWGPVRVSVRIGERFTEYVACVISDGVSSK